ncbi:MAG: type II secretion system protein [Candidatus Giovannonibacteria bacterium]|nr:type II secretion system protein [Candidatus Giovannonibacteria bacterium]
MENSKKSAGFTLLEMIVSLGIFAVAALLATSSLLSLTDAQKKTYSLQSAYDNIRFALETIAKDARTGDAFYCGTSFDDLPAVPTPRDCMSGGPSLTYKNVAGNNIAYRIFDSKIEKFVNGISAGYMTSGDTVIDILTFYVLGSPDGDNLQPRVTIIIKGTAGSGRSVSKFNLQTTISQRQIGI